MSTKIAVFFDCENVDAKYIDFVFKELQKRGEILIKQAFKDWSRKDNWDRDVCEKYAIEPIQVFNTTHKNSCDLRIQIAIFEILEYNVINTIAIISSDSDFTYIARFLMAKGLKVIGFGEAKTLDALHISYNDFIELPSLLDRETYSDMEKLKQALSEAIQHCQSEDGWCYVAKMSNYLKENYKISLQDFNELYWSKVFDKYNDIEYKKIGKSNSTLLVRINLSS